MVYETGASPRAVHLATVAGLTYEAVLPSTRSAPSPKTPRTVPLLGRQSPATAGKKGMRMPPLPPQGIAAVNGPTFLCRAGTLKEDVTC